MDKELTQPPPELAREPEDDTPGRAMDSELKVMSAIIRTLEKESPEARSRIVAYISHRYVRE